MSESVKTVKRASGRHTATYYKTRIEKARNQALCMGFRPTETGVLVLHDVGTSTKGSVSIREQMFLDHHAIDMMVDGTALRLAVTNSERSVQIFVDP